MINLIFLLGSITFNLFLGDGKQKREGPCVGTKGFWALEVRTCNHFRFNDCIIVIIFYALFIRILTHTIDRKGVMIGAITSGQITNFIGRKGVRWRILCRDCSYLSIFPTQNFSHNLFSLWVESNHGDVIHDLCALSALDGNKLT